MTKLKTKIKDFIRYIRHVIIFKTLILKFLLTQDTESLIAIKYCSMYLKYLLEHLLLESTKILSITDRQCSIIEKHISFINDFKCLDYFIENKITIGDFDKLYEKEFPFLFNDGE